MYLQHHGSKNDTDAKTTKMLFYALCVLYVLSLVTLSIDILFNMTVSKNFVHTNLNFDNLFFFNWTLIGCTVGHWSCQLTVPDEFCINHNKRCLRLYLPVDPGMHNFKLLRLSFVLFFIQNFKDLSLLDRVGSRYPCRDYSFNLNVCIPRSVNLSLFTS